MMGKALEVIKVVSVPDILTDYDMSKIDIALYQLVLKYCSGEDLLQLYNKIKTEQKKLQMLKKKRISLSSRSLEWIEIVKAESNLSLQAIITLALYINGEKIY